MGLTLINYDTWERKEFLEFFKKTTIYMTVQMDITALYHKLEQHNLRLYPALIYCVADVINSHQEFRYAYDQDGNIGIWDVIHPFYTVPRKNNPELFSMKCTNFTKPFSAFYEAFVHDYVLAEDCNQLICGQLPENICGVSIVPGTHFSGFSFSGDPKPDFTPFMMFGKFVFEGERVVIPVTGEFTHAVNDGIHISRFFDELEKRVNSILSDN